MLSMDLHCLGAVHLSAVYCSAIFLLDSLLQLILEEALLMNIEMPGLLVLHWNNWKIKASVLFTGSREQDMLTSVVRAHHQFIWNNIFVTELTKMLV